MSTLTERALWGAIEADDTDAVLAVLHSQQIAALAAEGREPTQPAPLAAVEGSPGLGRAERSRRPGLGEQGRMDPMVAMVLTVVVGIVALVVLAFALPASGASMGLTLDGTGATYTAPTTYPAGTTFVLNLYESGTRVGAETATAGQSVSVAATYAAECRLQADVERVTPGGSVLHHQWSLSGHFAPCGTPPVTTTTAPPTTTTVPVTTVPIKEPCIQPHVATKDGVGHVSCQPPATGRPASGGGAPARVAARPAQPPTTGPPPLAPSPVKSLAFTGPGTGLRETGLLGVALILLGLIVLRLHYRKAARHA